MARRVRVRRETTLSTSDKAKLTKAINEHVALEKAIEEQKSDLKAKYEEVQKLMKQYGLASHSTAKGDAMIVAKEGRASTTVDPVKFRTAVGHDVFMDCAKVNVGDAKKHLSDKELGEVSTVTPGKPGTPTLVITRK